MLPPACMQPQFTAAVPGCLLLPVPFSLLLPWSRSDMFFYQESLIVSQQQRAERRFDKQWWQIGRGEEKKDQMEGEKVREERSIGP